MNCETISAILGHHTFNGAVTGVFALLAAGIAYAAVSAQLRQAERFRAREEVEERLRIRATLQNLMLVLSRFVKFLTPQTHSGPYVAVARRYLSELNDFRELGATAELPKNVSGSIAFYNALVKDHLGFCESRLRPGVAYDGTITEEDRARLAALTTAGWQALEFLDDQITIMDQELVPICRKARVKAPPNLRPADHPIWRRQADGAGD